MGAGPLGGLGLFGPLGGVGLLGDFGSAGFGFFGAGPFRSFGFLGFGPGFGPLGLFGGLFGLLGSFGAGLPGCCDPCATRTLGIAVARTFGIAPTAAIAINVTEHLSALRFIVWLPCF